MLSYLKNQTKAVPSLTHHSGVPLSVIATFNRMKELSLDLNAIRTALRKSSNHIFQVRFAQINKKMTTIVVI